VDPVTAGALVRDLAVRGLVDHVLQQQGKARAGGLEPATPRELRYDLIMLNAHLLLYGEWTA
jgi:hypothetical protein